MATQIYKVRDPSGNIREIKGPAGASDDEIISQAKRLFADQEPLTAPPVQPDIQPLRPAPEAAPTQEAIPAPRRQFQIRNPFTQQPITIDVGETKKLLEPTIETASAIGGAKAGAMLGGTMGPIGAMVGGALGGGLGYATSRQFFEPVNVLTAEGAKEYGGRVKFGAEMEAGGQLITGAALTGLNKLREIAGKRATNLLVQALEKDKVIAPRDPTRPGPDPVEQIIDILGAAPKGMTAGEALANSGIRAPATQKLLERSLAREPAFLDALTAARDAQNLEHVGRIAGGTTQTAARETQEQAVKNLSQLTEPQKQAALARAGYGPVQQRYAAEAAAAREQAAQAVEGVRRFTRAAEEAAPRVQAEISGARFPGEVRTPFKASYMADLAQSADDVTTALAQQSLDAGGIARAKEAAIKTQQAYGLKPLTADSVLASIEKNLRDPKLAGNINLDDAMNQVRQVIKQWSGDDGLIDPRALDSIRKFAVTSISERLGQGNPDLQRRVASDLTSVLKPVITNAIEEAGGKGYAQYLKDYAKARQIIDQKKLGAEAMRLLSTPDGKKSFIQLVEGNSPDAVEKIFGPGSYDIAKELSADALATFKNISATERASLTAAEQASKGGEALREILAANRPKYKLPPWLDYRIAITNQALDKLADKIGAKTMGVITSAAKSGGSLNDILSGMRVSERARIELLFRQAAAQMDPAVRGAVMAAEPEMRRTKEREAKFRNALAPEPENALAK